MNQNKKSENIVKEWERIKKLRLIVTQKCNFNCVYCHGESYDIKTSQLKEVFSIEDYVYLFKICKEHLGFKNISITGGEPLVRGDILGLVKSLHEEGAKVSMITNGYKLRDYLDIGLYLDRIHISLNSTNDLAFKKIGQVDLSLENQLDSIREFRGAHGKLPIMIAVPLLKDGLDSENLKNTIDFANEIKSGIKYSEIYPANSAYYVPIGELEDKLFSMGYTTKFADFEKKVLTKGDVEIGLTKIVCATSKEIDNPGEFCAKVSSIYMAPDGDVRFCKNREASVNFKNDIHSRNTESVIQKMKNILKTQGKLCIYE